MSGFEAPDLPDEQELLNCIRCGMCLPSCPTYDLTGRERSSPRGRISLIRAVAEGHLDAESPVFAQEMSDCLGCLACVSACPAGVQYGKLLENARAQLHRRMPFWKRGLLRMALGLLSNSLALLIGSRLLYLYQRLGLFQLVDRLLPGLWRQRHQFLPTAHWHNGRSRWRSAQIQAPRGRLAVLFGCVMDIAFPEENLATARILERQGYEVVPPQALGCCGALAAHAGCLEQARSQAQQLIEHFEQSGAEALVVNSAGCSNCLKHYPGLFEEQPEWQHRARNLAEKTRDIHELLDSLPLNPPLPRNQQANITYHDACHLAHGQGIRQAPRRLLGQICSSPLRELGQADHCCGSAGTYNLTHVETASALLDQKVGHILASGAEIVAVANPGCLLQIRYGLRRCGSKVRAEHPVILLDQAWQQEQKGNRTVDSPSVIGKQKDSNKEQPQTSS